MTSLIMRLFLNDKKIYTQNKVLNQIEYCKIKNTVFLCYSIEGSNKKK